MTEPPASTPAEPGGDAPGHGGGEHRTAQPGPAQHAPGPAADHGRHEMAGSAGYPQFEGPGAPQYGSEPVEPPPPMPPHPGAPQPTYGPPGTMPPPTAAMPPPTGTMPPGAYQPPYQPPGAMPPPPPPGVPQPYGYQYAAPTGLDVGIALSYGWEKFRANAPAWIGVTALGVLIYLAFVIVVQITEVNSILPLFMIFLAVMVAVWLLQAALVRGALYETDGNRPAFGSFFRFVNAGNVLLTALLAFLATAIGFGFFILPGIVIGFLCMFSIHFVIDQDLGPFAALKASAVLVLNNLLQTLLLAIAVVVITFVAALLCGLGLLAAGPVCVMAVTYAYRVLSGGVVA
ncbi:MULTISPECIES: hypothetical protein [unclassified Nocardia]|uniref:hypothetical protein n=1 Tax=unclassified Nocardia TaxID=2637762 RepID=UPI001CE469C5|nr:MULTISPECIES: hypothetical protein [unclassified Nocardia]